MFNLYCIYDLKALKPVNDIFQVMPSDGAATRMFCDLLSVSNPESDFMRHPEDFALIRVGEVDFDTLKIDSYALGATEPVITGTAVVRARRTVESTPAPPTDNPMSEANDASSGERQLTITNA